MAIETRYESWANASDPKAVRRLDVRYEPVAASSYSGSGASAATGSSWMAAFSRLQDGSVLYWRDPEVDRALRIVSDRAVPLELASNSIGPKSTHLDGANNSVDVSQSIGLHFIGPAQVRLVDVELAVEEVKS